jgi:tRNA (uracil-5-)-methyltransferase
MKAIDEEPFHISYMHYNDHEYRKSLDEKIHILMSKIQLNKSVFDMAKESPSQIQVVESPVKYLRQRCRFAVLHSEQNVRNVNQSTNVINHLSYAMWEYGGPNIVVESFPIASIQIFNVMTVLLRLIELEAKLYDDLRAVNFLSTSVGDLIITLVYERPLDGAVYLPQIEALRQTLLSMDIESVGEISVIGRSKAVKLVAGRAWVMEELSLADGRLLRYKQVDEGFSNPNSSVNARVLDWLCEAAAMINTDASVGGLDLLEMYCGNGNHTVALAGGCQVTVTL